MVKFLGVSRNRNDHLACNHPASVIGSMVACSPGSNAASHFVCFLEDHPPTAAVAITHHLGHIAKSFPITLGQLDSRLVISKNGKAHLNEACCFWRKSHVKVHADKIMRIE